MGPIVLFQSVLELLKKSPNPRFVPIGSVGGMIGTGIITSPIGFVSYGVSKAALNWATRKIHFENEWLSAYEMLRLCRIPSYSLSLQLHSHCVPVELLQTQVSVRCPLLAE